MTLDKASLRKVYINRRGELSAQERQDKSAVICELLGGADFWAAFDAVAFYASDGIEVDLRALFERFKDTKAWFLPRYNQAAEAYEMVRIEDWKNDLEYGKYGLLEPRKELPSLDKKSAKNMLYLVPGVAFDSSGHRLGRGKGFYDQILRGRRGAAVGVFFDCQKAKEIACETHDESLDMVVTETGILNFCN